MRIEARTTRRWYGNSTLSFPEGASVNNRNRLRLVDTTTISEATTNSEADEHEDYACYISLRKRSHPELQNAIYQGMESQEDPKYIPTKLEQILKDDDCPRDFIADVESEIVTLLDELIRVGQVRTNPHRVYSIIDPEQENLFEHLAYYRAMIVLLNKSGDSRAEEISKRAKSVMENFFPQSNYQCGDYSTIDEYFSNCR